MPVAGTALSGERERGSTIQSSVPHQHREVGVGQYMARHAAEDEAAEPSVNIRAENKHVRAEFVCLRQQRLSENALSAYRKHVQLGLDSVFGEHVRYGWKWSLLPVAGQHEDMLGF
jgi:hypothetical protein